MHIQADITKIEARTPISDALNTYFSPHQTHRAFPIVRDGRFSGMRDRETLLKHAQALNAKFVSDLFGENLLVMALPEKTCRIVATRLAVHHLERLPVVRDAQSRTLLGLVSRSDLFKPSRSLLDEEHNYEQFSRTPPGGRRAAFRRR